MAKRRKQVHLKFKGVPNRAFWRRERPNKSSYPGYINGPVYRDCKIVYRHIPNDLIWPRLEQGVRNQLSYESRHKR